MRLVIDTNVILDVMMRREPFFQDSYQAIQLCNHRADAFFSATASTDIFYVLRKTIGSSAAKTAIARMMQLFICADTLQGDIVNALSSPVADFEDAVVEAMAFRLNADFILTRNIRDFSNSRVPVLTPGEFIRDHST